MNSFQRQSPELNVAVLIDYENVGVESLADLFDQISDVGRVIVKRAYADWSTVRPGAREQLLNLGIDAIQNFHASGSAKNSSDIRLAIDAVELLYRSPVDAFVIVSADSDFVPLVSKLRAGGKVVVGAGRRAVVSATLVKSCDRYIYLEKASPSPDTSKAVVSKPVQELLSRAMRASSDEEGKVVGAKLHQRMFRMDPSFDYKSLGFRTFTAFLKACEEQKIGIKISRSKGRDVIVESA
ncbi:MAG: NYN domain-containing protein [Chloroflexi bacterium]|nr:NYN domain-containing protein [Chloroflexota bacterium]